MAVNKVIFNGETLIDLTEDTVSADKLLENTTAHDRSGNIITGTIETKSSDDLIVDGATINVPKGYYSIQASKSVSSITQATPSISVSSSGLVTATSTQSAGYVVAGTKSATKQLSTKGSATYTPTTTNLTISSGLYLTGNQIIKGDSNLVASNIKKGISIFGVSGSYEASGGTTYPEYDGTFEGNAEIVLGYNISFATGNQYISGVTFYSLDNGTTWNDFYDIRNNANPVLTNVTQIKFKTIRRGTSYLYAGYIKIPSLSIELSSSKGNTYISDNIQLTNDVSDLTISYMQSVSGGGSDD